MSEIREDRLSVSYFDSLYRLLEECRGVGGLLRPLAFRVFHETRKRKESVYSDKSPFSIFIYEEKEKDTEVIYHQVMKACGAGYIKKLFGLSFLDILQLDYATFVDIDGKCSEYARARNQTMDEMQEELEDNGDDE